MMRRLTPSRHLCQGEQPPWRLIRTHLEQKPRLVLRTPLLTVLALGLAFRVLPLTQPNYLTGVLEYDGGVHYAAALALLHQQFPYANFAFLHPPGIIVLLAPFAAPGQILYQPVAMAAARLTMVAIGLASITLVWRLARGSDLVRAVAAGAYAVAPAVLVAEHTVLLEPLLNLGTLLALRMLLRSDFPVERGVRNAGLVLGLTMSIKIFAAVVPVAIALWLLSRRQYRLALLHVFAAGATFVLVLLPFVLRAPSAAVRDIALLQLRGPPAGIPTGDARLSDLLQLSPAFGHPVSMVGLLLAALAIAATLASVQHPRARLLSLMFLLTSASFFPRPQLLHSLCSFLASADGAINRRSSDLLRGVLITHKERRRQSDGDSTRSSPRRRRHPDEYGYTCAGRHPRQRAEFGPCAQMPVHRLGKPGHLCRPPSSRQLALRHLGRRPRVCADPAWAERTGGLL